MQGDRAFAEILQACLETTPTGEVGVADRVARYPEHAARLGELLLLSKRVGSLTLPAPTPEMLAAGEQRLLQAARARAPAGCGRWLRSPWVWLGCGLPAAMSSLCFLLCVIMMVLVVIFNPWPPVPAPTPTPPWMPTASPTVVVPSATPVATATGATTPFPPSPIRTPTRFPPSPIHTPTPLPPTLTSTSTPLPISTPVPPTPTSAKQPQPSLGFHPDELRADGCETSYRTTGSLKNHGGEEANWAANVQIGHEIVKGAEYVARVTVSPDFWSIIRGNETVNYTIAVQTNDAWLGQRDREIKVRLYIAREDNRPGHHQTQAHFTIANRCP